MSLGLKLSELAKRAGAQKEYLQTEAATSTALVLPFLSALGYDVFNPMEVVPEFTADVGTKKGEKVDYAIFRDGQPQILVEVKCWNVNLREVQASQLFRYYATTPARIAVLTNGFEYRFYADLVKPNTMDEKPFLAFDIREMRPQTLKDLEPFTRDRFEVEQVLDAAADLRHLNAIKAKIEEEIANPSEGLARHFGTDVHQGGRFTQRVVEQFQGLVKQAFSQVINEKIQSRLTSALDTESARMRAEEAAKEALPAGVVAIDGDIITTEEEVEAYEKIRTLIGEVIHPSRVYMRDAKSYCSILADDNNRKGICRLYFDRAQKYIGIFDENKQEQRVAIDSLDDIFKYAEDLRASAGRFVESGEENIEAPH